jgi:hypothetical protein
MESSKSHSNSPEGFLASYGVWSLERFLAYPAETPTTLVLVRITNDRESVGSREEVGTLILSFWDKVMARFDSVVGHRMSWSELAFVFAKTIPSELANAFATLSRASSDAACDIEATAAEFPAEVHGRREVLDEMEWRLAKQRYRQDLPGAWFIRNGEMLYLVGRGSPNDPRSAARYQDNDESGDGK